VAANAKSAVRPGPRARLLRSVVMVVMVVVMVMRGKGRRRRNHSQEQQDSQNSLHDSHPSMDSISGRPVHPSPASKRKLDQKRTIAGTAPN
jgi:hypothetical protein